MTAARPEPKSNEIYNLLHPSLEAGRNLLDEAVLFRLIRDARDIAERDQSLSIEGLAWIVADKLEKGIELCEQAIRLGPSSSANWVNYAAAVGCRGKNTLQRDILYRGYKQVDNPSILRHACNVALLWADYDTLIDIMGKIDKLQIDFPELKYSRMQLNLLRENEDEAINLYRLAVLTINIAESKNIAIKASRIFPDGDGYLIYSFMVDTNDENLVFDLNNNLTKNIIREELSKFGSIAVFDPLEEDISGRQTS